MESHLYEHIVYSTETELINSPAFYDCIVHIICNSGEVSLSYNDRPVTIKKDEIAVFSQPRLIKINNKSEDFSCEYIVAPGRFLNSLLPVNNYSIQGGVSLFANPIIVVSTENAEKFRNDLRNISQRINDTDHRFYNEMIGSLLQTMIYDLFDFHTRTNDNILTTNRVGYITSEFFAMITSGHPKTRRDVGHYADVLHVSSKYLSDTIKRVTGHSVSWHINKATTSIIIEYLNSNQLSINQIADEMQFTSVSYFSRYCRKHIGMSPAQYRVAGAKCQRHPMNILTTSGS